MKLKFFKLHMRKTKDGYVFKPIKWTEKIVKETDKLFIFENGGYVRKINEDKIGYRISDIDIFGKVTEVYTLNLKAKDCYKYILDSCISRKKQCLEYAHKNEIDKEISDIEKFESSAKRFLAKYH